MTKELQPAQPVPGERVTWTITVEDDGPSSAADVTVADPLDPALSDVEVTTTAGDCEVVDGTLGCDLGDLAPSDGPVVVTASALLDPSFTGTLSNTATVSSPTPDPVADDNTDTATGEAAPSADLSIVKTVSPAAPLPGARVTFRLAVDNEGPSTATDVTVTDALPAGLSGISATSGAGTCDPVGDDRVLTCHLGLRRRLRRPGRRDGHGHGRPGRRRLADQHGRRLVADPRPGPVRQLVHGVRGGRTVRRPVGRQDRRHRGRRGRHRGHLDDDGAQRRPVDERRRRPHRPGSPGPSSTPTSR